MCLFLLGSFNPLHIDHLHRLISRKHLQVFLSLMRSKMTNGQMWNFHHQDSDGHWGLVLQPPLSCLIFPTYFFLCSSGCLSRLALLTVQVQVCSSCIHVEQILPPCLSDVVGGSFKVGEKNVPCLHHWCLSRLKLCVCKSFVPAELRVCEYPGKVRSVYRYITKWGS